MGYYDTHEKDKESLKSIITEKALLKNDAINLLITILHAIVINDGENDIEIIPNTQHKNLERLCQVQSS